MESGSLKQSAFLALVSGITYVSVKLLYDYFSKGKMQKYREDDTEDTEYSYEQYSENTYSDVSQEWNSNEVVEDIVDSDSSQDEHFYNPNNNLVLAMDDKIIASNHCIDSDASSIASYNVNCKRVTHKNKVNCRENNAKKFLENLDKMCSKVKQKRLTLQDYKENLKISKGNQKRLNQDSNWRSEYSTIKSVTSEDIGSTKPMDEEFNNKSLTLQQKFMFEKQKHVKPQKVKEVSKKQSRRCKSFRKEDLSINYDDVNRKDNYIFFEVFAVYANNFIEAQDRSNENVRHVFKKRRTRKDRIGSKR